MAQFNWECIGRWTFSENIVGVTSLLEWTVMGHAKLDIHRRYFYQDTSVLKEKPLSHRVGI